MRLKVVDGAHVAHECAFDVRCISLASIHHHAYHPYLKCMLHVASLYMQQPFLCLLIVLHGIPSAEFSIFESELITAAGQNQPCIEGLHKGHSMQYSSRRFLALHFTSIRRTQRTHLNHLHYVSPRVRRAKCFLN